MALMTRTVPVQHERRSSGTRSMLWVAAALATAGVVIAGVLLGRAATTHEPPVVGTPVATDFGSFTVTRVSTTFVPATQGPPTAAKMMGTTGSDQLQVWVRFVNDDAAEGLRYSPDELRLVTGAAGAQQVSPADGSTLEAGTLPEGSSIDGQVWFDLENLPEGRRWLLYEGPDGTELRVPLRVPAGAPDGPGTGGDGHGSADH
jgi:hypothetical protein